MKKQSGNNEINLGRVLSFLFRWKRLLLCVGVVSILCSFGLSYLMPVQYSSFATLVPMEYQREENGEDKNKTLHQRTVRECEKMMQIFQSEMLLRDVCEVLSLPDYYGKGKTLSIEQASAILQGNMKAERMSFWGIKVSVWDVDSEMACAITQRMVSKVKEVRAMIYSRDTDSLLTDLQSSCELGLSELLLFEDSLRHMTQQNEMARRGDRKETRSKGDLQDEENRMKEQIALKRESLHIRNALLEQTRIQCQINSPKDFVLDEPRVTTIKDKPNRGKLIVASSVASLLVAVFVLLFFEQRRNLEIKEE